MPLEVAAPATPAPVVGDVASSTTVDYNTMSDDDILNSGDDVSAEQPAAHDTVQDDPASVEAKPVATEETPEETEAEKPEEALEGDYEPDALRRLFKDPAVKADLTALFQKHPKFRDQYFKAAQVSEMFGTVAEARELRSVFPDAATARDAQQRAAIFSQMDHEYTSDPASFAVTLARNSPDQFKQMMRGARQALYDLDPAAYRDTYGQPDVMDAIANGKEVAEETGDEQLAAAIAIFEDRLGISKKKAAPATGTAPQDPRLKRLEDIERRLSEGREAAVHAFSERTDGIYFDGLRQAALRAIGKPASMPEMTRELLADAIVNDVTAQMARRPELRAEYERWKRYGDMSEAHSKKAAGSLLAYANSYVGGAAKTRLTRWTSEQVAGNKAALEQVSTVKGNKDVGAGSGVVPAAKTKLEQARLPNGRFDYNKVTDDDILNS